MDVGAPQQVSLETETRIEPGSGSLSAASESPEALTTPSLCLELLIDHRWTPLRVLGARWDEGAGMYQLVAGHGNDTGQAQLCEGKSRILLCGRVVLELPSGWDPFVIPVGGTFVARWPFRM